MITAPLQTDAFGHTAEQLERLVKLEQARSELALLRAQYGDDLAEDDKSDSDYERPTTVNCQTGAVEYA